MCKKNRKQIVFHNLEGFQTDIDNLQTHIFKLDKDWENIQPLVVMLEEIKLKYLGESDYGEHI
tara:strand:+ start:4539 stop:4727 length:189 start_codon:yes stop_codon:yes gene_type:complete